MASFYREQVGERSEPSVSDVDEIDRLEHGSRSLHSRTE